MFVDFIHYRAKESDSRRKILSPGGVGAYRSAFKELLRQCKVPLDLAFEKEMILKVLLKV